MTDDRSPLHSTSTSSCGENFDRLPQLTAVPETEKMKSLTSVPRTFHKLITRSSPAEELSCQPIFSSFKMEPVTETAADNQDIIGNAQQSITYPVSRSRSILRPTHFICLPVQDEIAVESYKSFKSKVLENSERNPLYKDIDEDLFTSEYKLHFTFATLLLVDQKEIKQASEILEAFKESEVGEALSNEPFRITIRGLKVMQENPKQSHVLYATIQKSGDYERVQAAANALDGIFRKYGLHSGTEDSSSPIQDVKLHMTLLNSRNRLERQLHRTNKSKRRCVRRRPFDAEALLSEFGEYCFAEEIVIDCLKLCRMKSLGPSGFYLTETEIKLTDTKK